MRWWARKTLIIDSEICSKAHAVTRQSLIGIFPHKVTLPTKKLPSLGQYPELSVLILAGVLYATAAMAGPSHRPTFNTLAREKSFRNPPKSGSTYNILNEFVTPHIESFNSLFDDSGLPSGDGDGRGILSLALKDIGERTVFDGSGTDGWGNRMKCASV